jgi:hypothetical protein
MVQFRRDMNKRVLDRYRDDFEKALKLFAVRFIREGRVARGCAR